MPGDFRQLLIAVKALVETPSTWALVITLTVALAWTHHWYRVEFLSKTLRGHYDTVQRFRKDLEVRRHLWGMELIVILGLLVDLYVVYSLNRDVGSLGREAGLILAACVAGLSLWGAGQFKELLGLFHGALSASPLDDHGDGGGPLTQAVSAAKRAEERHQDSRLVDLRERASKLSLNRLKRLAADEQMSLKPYETVSGLSHAKEPLAVDLVETMMHRENTTTPDFDQRAALIRSRLK